MGKVQITITILEYELSPLYAWFIKLKDLEFAII